MCSAVKKKKYFSLYVYHKEYDSCLYFHQKVPLYSVFLTDIFFRQVFPHRKLNLVTDVNNHGAGGRLSQTQALPHGAILASVEDGEGESAVETVTEAAHFREKVALERGPERRVGGFDDGRFTGGSGGDEA